MSTNEFTNNPIESSFNIFRLLYLKIHSEPELILNLHYLLKSSPSNCLQPEMYSGTCLLAKSALSVTLFIFKNL